MEANFQNHSCNKGFRNSLETVNRLIGHSAPTKFLCPGKLESGESSRIDTQILIKFANTIYFTADGKLVQLMANTYTHVKHFIFTKFPNGSKLIILLQRHARHLRR